MRITMIRHGMTLGNTQKRYIGTTDERLCPEGIQALEAGVTKGYYPAADTIYVSPLKRCIETAELLYPGKKIQPVEEFREISFGIFENRNYEELKSLPTYQQWLDSGGEAAFPGGEVKADFVKRCKRGMDRLIGEWTKDPGKWYDERVAFIVHGGTIMALLSVFDIEKKAYYEYQVENGGGYVCETDLSVPFTLEVKKRIGIGGKHG